MEVKNVKKIKYSLKENITEFLFNLQIGSLAIADEYNSNCTSAIDDGLVELAKTSLRKYKKCTKFAQRVGKIAKHFYPWNED